MIESVATMAARAALPTRYGVLAHAVIADAINLARKGSEHSREWLADTASEGVGTLRFWCAVLSIHVGVTIAPEDVAKMTAPKRRVMGAINARVLDSRHGKRKGQS